MLAPARRPRAARRSTSRNPGSGVSRHAATIATQRRRAPAPSLTSDRRTGGAWPRGRKRLQQLVGAPGARDRRRGRRRRGQVDSGTLAPGGSCRAGGSEVAAIARRPASASTAAEQRPPLLLDLGDHLRGGARGARRGAGCAGPRSAGRRVAPPRCDEIAFGIEAHRAVAQVRRSDPRERIVHHHHLRVHVQVRAGRRPGGGDGRRGSDRTGRQREAVGGGVRAPRPSSALRASRSTCGARPSRSRARPARPVAPPAPPRCGRDVKYWFSM